MRLMTDIIIGSHQSFQRSALELRNACAASCCESRLSARLTSGLPYRCRHMQGLPRGSARLTNRYLQKTTSNMVHLQDVAPRACPAQCCGQHPIAPGLKVHTNSLTAHLQRLSAVDQYRNKTSRDIVRATGAHTRLETRNRRTSQLGICSNHETAPHTSVNAVNRRQRFSSQHCCQKNAFNEQTPLRTKHSWELVLIEEIPHALNNGPHTRRLNSRKARLPREQRWRGYKSATLLHL